MLRNVQSGKSSKLSFSCLSFCFLQHEGALLPPDLVLFTVCYCLCFPLFIQNSFKKSINNNNCVIIIKTTLIIIIVITIVIIITIHYLAEEIHSHGEMCV